MSLLDAKDQGAVQAWLINGDVGVSSKTLAALALGITPKEPDRPHDPSDLCRCIRLLDQAPGVRAAIAAARDKYPHVWGALAQHWDDLEGICRRDARQKRDIASELYLRMKEVFGEIEPDSARASELEILNAAIVGDRSTLQAALVRYVSSAPQRRATGRLLDACHLLSAYGEDPGIQAAIGATIEICNLTKQRTTCHYEVVTAANRYTSAEYLDRCRAEHRKLDMAAAPAKLRRAKATT